VPFRATRFQVPGSGTLRGSGRLRGLAPLTSPLRHPAVSSGVSPVSPMGLFPLRGPLSSAAVPRSLRTEVLGSRCSPSEPKLERFPGKAPRTGRPVRGASVRSPQRVARGFRSIPSWVARDAPSRNCSLAWFRRAAPEVCPGARVASRTSVGWTSCCQKVSVGAVSPASMGFSTSKNTSEEVSPRSAPISLPAILAIPFGFGSSSVRRSRGFQRFSLGPPDLPWPRSFSSPSGHLLYESMPSGSSLERHPESA
jgi:hypothetical protein